MPEDNPDNPEEPETPESSEAAENSPKAAIAPAAESTDSATTAVASEVTDATTEDSTDAPPPETDAAKISDAPAETKKVPAEKSPEKSPSKTNTGMKVAPSRDEYPYLQEAKVLIVEDSAPMRMMEKKTIGRMARAVDIAGNGTEGLAALRAAAASKNPHTLIFLDLMMPGMSGLVMLKHMRADPDLKETKVIIISAKNSRGDILACAKHHIMGYILKPFKTQALLEAAEKALTPPPSEDAEEPEDTEEASADTENPAAEGDTATTDDNPAAKDENKPAGAEGKSIATKEDDSENTADSEPEKTDTESATSTTDSAVESGGGGEEAAAEPVAAAEKPSDSATSEA